ncbi:peptidoglycan-binding domain-containing protein [Actinomadura sp. NBRC 104425]|uniref:peptidoglycan-binding domain-containing protein n=1 Tax=Actinomadura sp. NBRC 104425 TaxID=3032204 RepID=UPI0025574EF6|nr:peptidoglycan-binding domain-containing protein [Actinomadura sp. NBRC 104425]
MAVAVAAGGAATAAALNLTGDAASEQTARGLPPSTAKVTRETLRDTQDADGVLAYGEQTAATSRLRGTLTALPDSGDRITRGKTVYRVDDKPVTLMYGSRPMYRDLRPGVEGEDVHQLERNLQALGYDGFTVDDEYTGDTADAVREWQDDRGLDETGVVELGRVLFTPGAIRVDSLEAGEGDPVSPGRKVLNYTGTEKAVTVQLEATDQRLAKEGADVEVTMPDDQKVQGRVDEVSTVIEPGGSGEEPQTKVEVTVALEGRRAQQAAEPYAMAAVDVTFTAGTRENVLTVPIAALLALREGGFGVEVVQGGRSSYVPVRTGLFADGKVEISGSGITEGTVVGMPK